MQASASPQQQFPEKQWAPVIQLAENRYDFYTHL